VRLLTRLLRRVAVGLLSVMGIAIAIGAAGGERAQEQLGLLHAQRDLGGDLVRAGLRLSGQP
jgi:hypothetical protein